LTALNRCDIAIGPIPSDGAHAELSQIKPFVEYMSKCQENALTISIRGAKGENIEDADDWRKNLKLKYRDQINKPEATEELVDKIMQKDFIGLLQYIDHELSEFYSVFTSVQWKPSNGNFSTTEQGVCCSDIEFYKEFNVIKTGITLRIRLTIQQFLYRIEVITIKDLYYGQVIYKKEYSYSEFIAEQDQVDIINAIGNFLNQFIETHGFTNKML
jgi:hypothetical protein